MTPSAAVAARHYPRMAHAARVLDRDGVRMAPPVAEACALDIDDAAVRRVAISATAFASVFVLAGLVLAYSAG